MHGAGFQGRPEIASELISFGLEAGDVHKDGFTPLHRACWGREKRHAETVRVLVEEGGLPVDVKSGAGTTCDDVTTNPHTKKVIEKLRKKYSGDL